MHKIARKDRRAEAIKIVRVPGGNGFAPSVLKLCNGCGTYFAGELNGDYTCTSCREMEKPAQPHASSLQSLFFSGSRKLG